MPLSSADKPGVVEDDTDGSASSSSSPTIGARKLVMPSSSADKPDMTCMFAFYDITWDERRFNRQEIHEATLGADIRVALNVFNIDVLLLSECGEVDEGLTPNLWLPMIRRICGPGFDVTHQGHYTSIVKRATMQITAEPSLRGPLTTVPHHAYRMCQHLQVVLKGSGAKPIHLYNCHSPASSKHPLTPLVRRHILEWFLQNMGPQAILGGNLNSSVLSLDDVFKGDRGIHYCYESDHLHGDVAIARGLQAESMPCEVRSTSKAHKMVVVMATVRPQAAPPDPTT